MRQRQSRFWFVSGGQACAPGRRRRSRIRQSSAAKLDSRGNQALLVTQRNLRPCEARSQRYLASPGQLLFWKALASGRNCGQYTSTPSSVSMPTVVPETPLVDAHLHDAAHAQAALQARANLLGVGDDGGVVHVPQRRVELAGRLQRDAKRNSARDGGHLRVGRGLRCRSRRVVARPTPDCTATARDLARFTRRRRLSSATSR